MDALKCFLVVNNDNCNFEAAFVNPDFANELRNPSLSAFFSYLSKQDDA